MTELKLDFARIKTAALVRLVPQHLIESVKGRTFSVEQFYSYQEHFIEDPHNFLFALLGEDRKIEGYLWAEQSGLDQSLFINTFSVSKKYWGNGKAIPLVIMFLKELKEKIQAPRVFWFTTNEKFFLKQGFKRSKNVLMEVVDTVDNLSVIDKECTPIEVMQHN